jgi:hypothetical protein
MLSAVESPPIALGEVVDDCLDCYESDYCQPWPSGREMTFQVQYEKTGYDILGDVMEPLEEGVTTTIGSSQIIDGTANFTSPPILVNQLVANTDTDLGSKVDTVASTTSVDIDDDIFGTGTLGDGYAISQVRSITGNVLYKKIGAEFQIEVSPTAIIDVDLVVMSAFPNTINRFVVEIDVANYVSGNFTVQSGSYPSTWSFFGEQQDTITGNGTYVYAGTPSNTALRIVDTTEQSRYTITGIRVYYTQRPEIIIYDEDGVEVQDYDPTEYIRNRANFEVDWDFTEGCYRVYLDNFNGLVGRSNFPNSEGWVFTNVNANGWSISANKLIHVTGVNPGTDTAVWTLPEPAIADCHYVIYVNLVAPDSPPLEIPTISIVTPDGDVAVSGYISTSGNNYINIYGYDFTAIKFSMPTDEAVSIGFFNVYNTYYLRPGGYYTPDGNESISAFQLAEDSCAPVAYVCVQTLDCDHLLFESTIENTDVNPRMINNRLIAAESTYYESMFVRASIRNARYETDGFQAYRTPEGRGRVVYGQRKKIKEVQLAAVPTWVHDWMTWAILNDFSIDNTEYVPVDGSYSPDWGRLSADASAVFEVYSQDQKVIKKGC